MPLPIKPQGPNQSGTAYGTPQNGVNADQMQMRGFQNGQPIYGYTHPTPTGPSPSGYDYDSVQGKYVPHTSSNAYQTELEQRRRAREDIVNQQNDIELTRQRGRQDQNDQYNRQSINTLQNLYTNLGSGGPTGGPSGAGGNTPPPSMTTPPTPGVTYNPNANGAGGGAGNTTLNTAAAAQDAAFGRAKATAGSLGQSALQSLQAQMAGRGISGSGVEGRGIVDALANATNPLSDLNASALHENVGITQHNQDLAQQGNLAAYNGGITQRGQDITTNQGNANRALDAWKLQQELLQQQRLAALGGLQNVLTRRY